MKTMKSRFILAVVMVFALASILAGCSSSNSGGSTGGGDEEQTYTIKYAHNQLEGTPQDQGTVLFKEKVEELSEGRIKVEIYPNNQLGSLREVTESVQGGQIELGQQPLGMISNFASKLTINDLPYLYTNEEVMWQVLDGAPGERLNEEMESSGFINLGYMSGGPKQFSANKPLRTVEDFKGVRIRAMPAPIVISTFEALGANPIPIEFSELYNSLQQGVVEGQENPNQTVDMLNLYEVQDYQTLTNHSWMVYANIMNKAYWESLPKDIQDIILEAMEYASKEQRVIMQNAEAEYIESIEANGCEVVELTDEEIAGLREATLKVYDEFTDEIGADLIEEFKAEVERLSK